MKAIEKYMEDEKHSVFWTNVLTGQCRGTVDVSKYCVKIETFRKQARAEGFRTALWGDEIQLYR